MHKKLKIFSPVGRFFGAGEVFTGPGSFSALSAIKSSRIFIIHSSSFINSLNGTELANKVFSKKIYNLYEVSRGEPILENMSSLFKEIADFKPDCIIAIGGGSVIDMAKLSWIFYEHPDISNLNLTKAFSIPLLRGKSNFIAVPTTAGTGSEMSSAAVFQVNKSSPKSFAVSHDLIPDIAVLDPTLILSVPKSTKIYSGLDALSHSVEGYASLFSNKYTQDLSELSIRILFNSLHDYVDIGDVDSADEVLRASNLAGVVQNISVPGLGHALSHQMSSFGISHGNGCGKFLPIAMKINSKKESVNQAYEKLAKRLDFGTTNDLILKIESLLDSFEVSIPNKILNRVSDDKNFVSRVLKDPTARANPLKLSDEHILEALDMARY
jgi:acetaldehyde dehydrogenase/alcohol dehydrogenase